MDDQEFKRIVDSLTVVTNDSAEQEAIDLQSLNLCDPDNIADYSMPYPDLPQTTDEIQEVLDSSVLDTLINADTASILATCKSIDPSASEILSEILGQDTLQNPLGDIKVDNHVIVEFGDDYTLGEAVEYTLDVSPGQTLNNSTIMGSVVQGDVRKTLRSIFAKATVMETDDHDFLRLFPDAHADRHIVLTDVEYGTGCDYDYNDILDFQTKFAQATSAYTFIVNNMCYATLPNILLNREKWSEHYIYTPLGVPIPNPVHLVFDGDKDSKTQPLCTNGQKRYEIFMNDFDDELEAKLKWSVEPGSADNIKATKGNTSKIADISKQLEERRRQTIDWIHEKYKQSFNLGACRYDPDYSDCRFLATGVNLESQNLDDQDFQNTKIGYTTYSNYYMDLLSKLTLSDYDPWSKKYYDILSGIIQNRMSKEKYSKAYLASEFNQLFQSNFQMNIEDPFQLIDADLGSKDDCTYTDVQAWFTKLVTVGYTEASGETTVIESQHTGTSAAEDSTLVNASTQLANIYWFIKNLPDEQDTMSMAQNSDSWDIMDLIREEQEKLYNFWEDVYNAYDSNKVENVTKEFEEYVAGLTQYAEWPAGAPIEIEGLSYTLYEFQNPFITPDASAADEDFNMDDFVEPTIPDTFDVDPATLKEEDVNDDNDPSPAEPTVKDYEYWVRYFSLATVISVIYLADGLDIPTPGGLIPTPLPCIYVCVGCVYIKIFNMVLVFGLGIRGVYIYPVVLVVNLSNHELSFMTPLIAILQMVHDMFTTQIEKMEMLVPNLVQLIINKLEKENQEYRKKNDEYMVYTETLKAQRITNKGMLKKKLQELYANGPIKQVYTRTSDLVNAAESTYKDTTAKLTKTDTSVNANTKAEDLENHELVQTVKSWKKSDDGEETDEENDVE